MRANGNATLFTIGYQGHTPDSLVTKLKENGIDTVADVRERASSRKSGFSRNALGGLLAEHGVDYVHLPGLGSPAFLRKKLAADGDFDYFEKCFRESLPKRREPLERVRELMRWRAVCLLCYESDATSCHRRIVASELSNLSHEEMRVSHL